MFRKWKLWQKISVASITIALIAVLVAMTVAYEQYGRTIERYNHVRQQQLATQLSGYYDEKLSKVINLAHSIIESPYFRTALEEIMWDEGYIYAKELSTIQNFFQNIMQKDQVIHSCYLYTPRGQFYNTTSVLVPGFDFTKSELYARIAEHQNIYWGSAGISEIFTGDSRIIPVIMRVPFGQDNSEIYMVINLSEKEILDRLTQTGAIICDAEGRIITAPTADYASMFFDEGFLENLFTSPQFEYQSSADELFVQTAEIHINNWYVVSIQTERSLFSDLRQLRIYTLLIGAGSMLLATFSAVSVAKTVTKPLYALSDAMRQVQTGDLAVRYRGVFSDFDVEQLGSSFNRMLDHIQKLLCDLNDEQEKTLLESQKKRNAELRALQEQINPHFLYNTLDSLYWKSKAGDANTVSEMIIALSNLFRISLSRGAEEVAVKMEAEHVRLYLYLQSIIYNGKFTYEIDVDEKALNYPAIKILLQPIVENCVVHATKNTGSIHIQVRILLENKTIRYIVSDTGIGFDAEELNRSVREIHTADSGGYALKNIYMRLALAYGNAGGIGFSKGASGENVVEIYFPAKES